MATTDITDFGVTPDSGADCSAAFQAAMDSWIANPRVITVPSGDYIIETPCAVELTDDIGKPFGFVGVGANLISGIVGANRTMLKISSLATVRYLQLQGLKLLGNGGQGNHGLQLDCLGSTRYLYNVCLRDLQIEQFGGNGIVLTGNIFESSLFNVHARDNGECGMLAGSGTQGGVLSSVRLFGGTFGQNGQHGVRLADNAYDVGFHGVYFVTNGRAGLLAPNGFTCAANCGFENNWVTNNGGGVNAGVEFQAFGYMAGCTGSTGNQRCLASGFVVDQFTMLACASDTDLCNVTGSVGAKLNVIGGKGGVLCAAPVYRMES